MIVFLYGSDDFRVKRKIRELKDKFKKEVDTSGDSISFLDGEKLSLDDLNTAVNSGSLFVRRRMVVVEDLFLNKKNDIFPAVLDFLKKEEKKNKDPKEGNIIIFSDNSVGKNPTKAKKDLWKFLSGSGFAQEFKQLSNTELNVWIKKEASQLGVEINLAVAQELASMTGNDLWRIKNELDKLINYKQGLKLLDGGKMEISKEDIEVMVRGKFDDNIFSLTEAIGAKNKKLALDLFEEQMQAGNSFDYILTMVIWQFKRLIQVRQALDLGHNSRKIINELGLHPFVVQKNISLVRNFNLDYLKKTLKELIEINKKSRQSGYHPETLLSLFIVKV